MGPLQSRSPSFADFLLGSSQAKPSQLSCVGVARGVSNTTLTPSGLCLGRLRRRRHQPGYWTRCHLPAWAFGSASGVPRVNAALGRLQNTMTETGFDATDHFSDRHSCIYDQKIRKVIPGYDAMHEMAQYLLQDNLPSVAKVLIVGAGTGQKIVSYANANLAWTVVGVDSTVAMLAIASQRVQKMGLGDRVSLIEGVVKNIECKREFMRAFK